MNKQRHILDRAVGMVQVYARDVRVGETITYPRDAYFSFEVEEAEGCSCWSPRAGGEEAGIRFRHATGSSVYAERELVWISADTGPEDDELEGDRW